MASEEKKLKLENGSSKDPGKNKDFLPGYSNIDRFTQESLKRINLATKASNAIPSDRKEDWDYYSTFKAFRQVMNVQGDTIKRQVLNLLEYNGIKIPNPGNNVADNIEMLTEANDQILERISMNLDEAEGIRKDANPLLVEVSQFGMARISGSWNKNMGKSTPEVIDLSSKTPSNHASSQIKLLAGKHVLRPQINFRDRIDNSSNPFIPQLKEKPYFKKPLSILIEHEDDGTEFYSHPYLFELDHICLPKIQYEKTPDDAVGNYKSSLDTEMLYVDNVESLNDMINELKTCNEIGVDVEHHSYRSFLGLTCLIQISTVEKDYIVDPFPLWSSGNLTALNEIFANPNIIKILHGAVNDIIWIQRDFSLYIVNMFDTYIAAKTLGFPRGCLSLAFLLQHYCNNKTDKKFQLADWRIRPLTEEMVQYARSDTRYLIKIYHLMKNGLLDQGNENKNLLNSVYDQSNDVCKQRYEKPLDDYLKHLRKSNISFNSRQQYVYKELFDWRNKIARLEDESAMYVLPPHMLLKISSELPREMQGIVACCNPVPPLVKQNLHYLHQIVFKAREQQLTAVPAVLNASNSVLDTSLASQSSIFDVLENPFKCPLDLSSIQRHQEHDGNLPVLLKATKVDCDSLNRPIMSIARKEKPELDIFSSSTKSSHRNGIENINIFLSPFQRLQLLKPYLEAMIVKQEGVKVENKRTDDERVQSIKAHFDALTAMTPEEYSSDMVVKSENGGNNAGLTDSENSENDSDKMLDSYNPDPGKIKPLRKDLKAGRTQFKKQRNVQHQKEQRSINDTVDEHKKSKIAAAKMEGHGHKRDIALLPEADTAASKRVKLEGEQSETKLDFDNADFSQYSCGAKGQNKQFNPWNETNKKGRMNQKGKTGFKGGSKTFHYKKSK